MTDLSASSPAAPPALPPIKRSVLVSWAPDLAFRRFTADFAAWWPRATHSIGGPRVRRIDFECRLGGLIVEELLDGRRFQWGRVTAWDPPRLVGFLWHPSRDESSAQDVTVRFIPEGGGTRVELVSTGWERLGAKAGRERKGYSIGWGAVLDVFAGRRSAAVVTFGALSHVITFVLRATGRLESSIDHAGGRISAG